MKITETTPPPTERTFSLEFTENELKLLGMALGQSNPHKIQEFISENDWRAKNFPGVKFEDDKINSMYDAVVAVFKS